MLIVLYLFISYENDDFCGGLMLLKTDGEYTCINNDMF